MNLHGIARVHITGQTVRELLPHLNNDPLQEHAPFVSFHIDHVIPRKHGGDTVDENLALACIHCNLHKSMNLSGIDPQSGEITTLFNPRRDRWDEHFGFENALLVGLTATGRATIPTLNMNGADRLELREELLSRGESL